MSLSGSCGTAACRSVRCAHGPIRAPPVSCRARRGPIAGAATGSRPGAPVGHGKQRIRLCRSAHDGPWQFSHAARLSHPPWSFRQPQCDGPLPSRAAGTPVNRFRFQASGTGAFATTANSQQVGTGSPIADLAFPTACYNQPETVGCVGPPGGSEATAYQSTRHVRSLVMVYRQSAIVDRPRSLYSCCRQTR